VNDGSTDDTDSIASKWSGSDERIVYIKQANGGVANARNNGVAKSKGEFILPLDADDYISSNYIETCVHEIGSSDEIKLVYGEAIKFGVENEKWEIPAYTFNRLLQYNMIFCTSLYRRSDFNTIGGYDENMKHGLEDWELWIRLLKTGGEVIHTSKCQFYYRIKEESRNSDLYRDDSKVNEAYNYIFKKHLASYEVSNSVELYKKYSNTKHELDNLHLFLSFKEIFKLFLKKVQNILFKVVKRVKRGDS
jgi:glycosyltransferase involved in cell wall biosynthesis